MLMKLRKMMTNQKGFTLVELMVVIAIIGVLAAIAIPKFSASTGSAKDGKMIADLRTIDGILVQIYADSDTKEYPADLTGLSPKYLKELPKGADGQALSYTLDTGAQGYVLTGTKADKTSVVRSPGSTPATKP